IFFSLPSIFVGCIAYKQQSIKSVLALTTVSQLAYIVSGTVVNNILAWRYSLLYFLIYGLHIIAIFICMLRIKSYISCTHLNHLSYIYNYSRWIYYILLILFFSLAGIPP